MSIWNQNARWLESDHPQLVSSIEETDSGEVKVFPSRQGEPTATVGAVRLHSSYNPISEAEGQSKPVDNLDNDAVVVVCGLGLGYLAEAVLRKYSGTIIVVEPSLSILKAALESRDLENLKGAVLVFNTTVEEAIDCIEARCGSGTGWKRVKLVVHPSSLKLNPEYFSEIQRVVQARSNLSVSGLGILVVTPMYGGSLPVARYCASAFERLGHRVDLLDNAIYDPARLQIENITSNRQHREQLGYMLNTLMAESITARALDQAVDLVFLVAQSPVAVPVLDELRKHKIPVAFWFVEDWRLFTYWREMAPRYDYFFTIQKGDFFNHLERIGTRNQHYLPLAADPTVHRPLELDRIETDEFGSAISHVGAGYRNRRQVFSGLTDLDFKLWGSEWDTTSSLGMVLQRNGERISTEESVKIFNATSINLNLHSSPFHEGVNPEGDYLNPRTFEIASCGGFQLVDQRQHLDEHFKPGEEITVFRSAAEMREQIDYYLLHPEERQEIAQRARQRILRDHTYDIRMSEALDFIYSHETTLASHRHPDHIDNLLRDAEADEELKGLLEKFKDKGVLKLDDIILDIKERKGELSRTESIFLLMNEFRRWAREKELA